MTQNFDQGYLNLVLNFREILYCKAENTKFYESNFEQLSTYFCRIILLFVLIPPPPPPKFLISKKDESSYIAYGKLF